MESKAMNDMLVKKENRYGYTAGCWDIDRRLAKKLCKDYCDRATPRVGYELILKTEKGAMGMPRRAYVANLGGKYRLYDENRILGDVIEK